MKNAYIPTGFALLNGTRLYRETKGRGGSRILLLSLIVICFFLNGCSVFKAISLVKGGEIADAGGPDAPVNFHLNGHLILVKAKINRSEKAYTFLVDTAALTVVSEELAKNLHLQQEVEINFKDSAGGKKKTFLTKLDSLVVDGNEVKNLAAAVLDLSKMENGFGVKIDGIIGSNFLRHFKVTIDYRGELLIFSRDATPAGMVQNSHVLKFEQAMEQGFAPRIEIAIDGVTTDAYVDTGYIDVLGVPFSLLEKLDYGEKGRLIESKGSMGWGAIKVNDKMWLARADLLNIGGIELKRIPLRATRENKTALLGKDFLSQFIVILNYPAGEMVLTPYEKVLLAENEFAVGLGLFRNGEGKYQVSGVWSGSPADKNGIGIGDEILAINGKSPNEYTFPDLRNILKVDESIESVDFLIKNQDGVRKVAVKKEYLFPK